MRRVYKWPWDARSLTMDLPWSPGDKVLMVAEQRGVVTLWAEQEDSSAQSHRTFTIVGTGDSVPAGQAHVGSAVVGAFVWHIYAEPAR